PGGADGWKSARDARGFCHFGEGPIAIVMEQPIGNTAIEQAAQIIGDEQVQITVAIVIHPRSGEAGSPGPDAGLLGHVGKSAVSIVVEERALANVEAHARDEQVYEAVIIVVTTCDDESVD